MKAILKNLMILFLGSIFIVGCGRKGTLESLPSTAAEPLQGALISKSKADKSFVLDQLIQ
ncbi:hypothetical protein BAnh1_12480 [Bartonella australis AUST/NH1]|uniref:Lipoprotein n=1 Tax=Bartonella australis (strain Aust/NH1) TaxID=1094489 RepID=M1P5J2_BARAA|nr:hypothetical protein [Bartonella australis]AGF75115.1 hypothetical protein BAnh1_12480 [Bartonella australis AUST/NH1]